MNTTTLLTAGIVLSILRVLLLVAVVVVLVLILKQLVKLVAFVVTLPIKIIKSIWNAITGKKETSKNSQNKKRA